MFNQNNPFIDYATQVMQQNPNMTNNPLGKNFMSILQNGDEKKGEEMARNLCQSYGMSVEEAYNQAMRYFGRK